MLINDNTSIDEKISYLTFGDDKEKCNYFINELKHMIICYKTPKLNLIKELDEFLFLSETINCPAIYSIFCFLFSNISMNHNFLKGDKKINYLKEKNVSFSKYDEFYVDTVFFDIFVYEKHFVDINFKEYIKKDLLLANIIKVNIIVKFGFDKKEKMKLLFNILYDKNIVNDLIKSFNSGNSSDYEYYYCLTLSFICVECEEYELGGLLCKTALLKYPDNFYLIHNLIHILQMNSKWVESIYQIEDYNINRLLIDNFLFESTNNGIFIKNHLAWHLAIAYLEKFKIKNKTNTNECFLDDSLELIEKVNLIEEFKNSLMLFQKIVHNFYNDTEYFVNILGYCIWFTSIFNFNDKSCDLVIKCIGGEIIEKIIEIAENFENTFSINCTFDFLITWMLSLLNTNKNEEILLRIFSHYKNLEIKKQPLGKYLFQFEVYPKYLKSFYYLGKKQISLSKLFLDTKYIEFLSGSEEQRQIYRLIAQ